MYSVDRIISSDAAWPSRLVTMDRLRKLQAKTLMLSRWIFPYFKPPESLPEIKEKLEDPNVELNLQVLDSELPLDYVIKSGNVEVLRLFLACPRINWLEEKNLRCTHKILDELELLYDFACINLDHLERDEGYFAGSYFPFYLYRFEKEYPEDVQAVFEKIIEQLLETKNFTLEEIITECAGESFSAFKAALKFKPDFHANSELGSELMHYYSVKLDVVKLLLEMGADVNALDEKEMTPLMSHVIYSNLHLQIVKLLIEHGADLNFINSKGQSAFSRCGNKAEFLEHFELDESVFVAALKCDDFAIEPQELETIFAKYTKYKEIFDSGLPSNLPAVRFDEAGYLQYFEKMNEDDGWMLMKNLFSRFYDCLPLLNAVLTRFPERKAFFTAHSNELLLAFITNNGSCKTEEVISALINDFGANPSGVVDGKAPLFLCNWDETFEILLAAGADPFLEIDGRLFFESERFLQRDFAVVDAKWLVALHKKGFDLFKPAKASGKSLIDRLAELSVVHKKWKVSISIDLNEREIQIPINEVCVQLFEVLSLEKPDFSTCIDDEGNTLLSSLIKNDHDFKFGARIKNSAEFKAYIAAYDKVYGEGHFKAHVVKNFGGFIVLEALRDDAFCLEIADFKLGEMCVNLDRLMWVFSRKFEGYRKGIMLERLIEDFSHPRNREIKTLLTKYGYEGDLQAFIEALRNESVDKVKYFLKHFKNESMLCSCLTAGVPFNEAFKVVVSDERIANYAKENSFFEYEYFRLCDSIEKMKFFHELGVDARKLKGKELPVDDKHRFTLDMWRLLREYGWSSEDFDHLTVNIFNRCYKSTFYQYLVRESDSFKAVFGRGEAEDSEPEEFGLFD